MGAIDRTHSTSLFPNKWTESVKSRLQSWKRGLEDASLTSDNATTGKAGILPEMQPIDDSSTTCPSHSFSGNSENDGYKSSFYLGSLPIGIAAVALNKGISSLTTASRETPTQYDCSSLSCAEILSKSREEQETIAAQCVELSKLCLSNTTNTGPGTS